MYCTELNCTILYQTSCIVLVESALCPWVVSALLRANCSEHSLIRQQIQKLGIDQINGNSPLLCDAFDTSGYFTDEGKADIATMREGLKLSRKLANSESFSKYKGEEIFPGKHVQSDAELDAYIRDVSYSLCIGSYHISVG